MKESHPPCGFSAAVGTQCKHTETNGTTKVMCYNSTEPQGGVPRTLKQLRNPFQWLYCTDVKLGINSISLLCTTQNAFFLFPCLMNLEWINLHLVQSFVFFLLQLDALKKNPNKTLNAVLESTYMKNHAYYNHNNKTKTNSSSNQVHPLLSYRRRENALLLSQSKGQGSARFPSEQICTNKYITCPILHSVAEWQSGAVFFSFSFSSPPPFSFSSPPSEQLARRTIIRKATSRRITVWF